MVVILKFESKWGQTKVGIVAKENTLLELLKKNNKIECLLDELTKKLGRLIGIEEGEI